MPIGTTEQLYTTDAKARLEAFYGPYDSLALARAGIPMSFRTVGKEASVKDVNGIITKYVFSGGILDEHLVLDVAEDTSKASHSQVQPYTAQQYFVPRRLSISSAVVSWNCNTGQKAEVVLTENITIPNPNNMVNGGTYSLALEQDNTGSRLVTWGTAFDFGEDGEPVLTTDGGKTDVLIFESNGNKMYFMGIKKGFTNYLTTAS